MMLRLEIPNGSGGNAPFEHSGPHITIGRDPACELSLPGDAGSAVSWQHARIEVTADGAFIRDLQSTNGTFVNDRRLEGRSSLNAGDYIRLGQTGPYLKLVEIDLRAERPPAASRPVPPPSRPPIAPKERQSGPDALLRLASDRRVLAMATAAIAVVVVALVGTIVFKRPAAPPVASAQASPEQLQKDAHAILTKYCHQCHGGLETKANLDVLSEESLYKKRGRKERAAVVPRDPTNSYLWERVDDGSMPPPDEVKDRLTAEEKGKLKDWITSGGKLPKDAVTLPGPREILAAIHTHLMKFPAEQRRHQRYFTIAHLANNKQFKPADLRLHRAALAKLANSLSWRPEIVVPSAVDRAETIYHLDLRDLGWTRTNFWSAIVRLYPYGLRHDFDTDESTRKTALELYRFAETPVPFLRADWFIARVSQPPLYHDVLELPQKAGELERMLEVDFVKNFRSKAPKLWRAGFNNSGVSTQNRLIERHDARYGAYWKSYDFKSNEGTGNLVKFPLGPAFKGNKFADVAFRHDGGEMIFNLPNGLQAYLLTDGKDNRIDKGPIEVVRDVKESAGTPQIVNGLSCMACHKDGMLRNTDIIRKAHAVAGEALFEVERLYPVGAEMEKLFKKDEERFLKAVAQATRKFLKADDQAVEPIGASARVYLKRDLKIDDAAYELGLHDPAQLKLAIEANKTLREIGLGPLASGNAIKREMWESISEGLSAMQVTARELGLGTPVRESHPADLPPR